MHEHDVTQPKPIPPRPPHAVIRQFAADDQPRPKRPPMPVRWPDTPIDLDADPRMACPSIHPADGKDRALAIVASSDGQRRLGAIIAVGNERNPGRNKLRPGSIKVQFRTGAIRTFRAEYVTVVWRWCRHPDCGQPLDRLWHPKQPRLCPEHHVEAIRRAKEARQP